MRHPRENQRLRRHELLTTNSSPTWINRTGRCCSTRRPSAQRRTQTTTAPSRRRPRKLVDYAKAHMANSAPFDAKDDAQGLPNWCPLPAWATPEVQERLVLIWIKRRKGDAPDEEWLSIPPRRTASRMGGSASQPWHRQARRSCAMPASCLRPGLARAIAAARLSHGAVAAGTPARARHTQHAVAGQVFHGLRAASRPTPRPPFRAR